MCARKLLFGLAILMALTVLASEVSATGGLATYGTSLSPVEVPYLDGPALLEFGIYPQIAFDSIIVRSKPIGNIEYQGKETWTIKDQGMKEYKYRIEVNIPPDDTCGIEFEVYSKGFLRNSSSLHFVTTGDTLELSKNWPKPKYVRQWPLYLNDQGDTLDTDSLIAAKKAERDKKNREKSRGVKYSTRRAFYPPTKQEIKDSLEREPKISPGSEFIEVDGVMWVRNTGEREFRRAGVISDPLAFQDSVQAAMLERAKTDNMDVIFDLRLRDDYEKLRQLVEELIPMERDGFYRAITTRDKVIQAKEIGINWSRYPEYPQEKKKATPRRPDKSRPHNIHTTP